MLTRLLLHAASRHPEKAAIVQGERRVSYRELCELVEHCASGLRSRGVAEGDCVAVVLPNCPEFIVTLFASASIGAILLPLNPQYKKEELQRFLEDAAPRVIVGGELQMPSLLQIAAGAAREIHLVSVGGPLGKAIPWATLLNNAKVDLRSWERSGRALYLYTSGSTDTYKRVCCTQENLYWEARNFIETAGLTAEDTILCTIPLFHSYGIGNCLLDAAYLGATLVLLPQEPDAAGADPPFANRCHRVAELVRAESVRFYPGVPYQFSVLASLPEHFPIDLSPLKLCVSSGDVLPASTCDRFLARYRLPIRSLYGSTEAGSIALGPPLRNVTIEIRDAQGNRLPPGVDGEIWVKSPTLPPSGYDNRADLNHTVFQGGFYNTGDIGHQDQRGHLLLAGRKQSFINIAGNKVDVLEVEEVLASCPGVREAAVLGVEIPRMGTLVKAVVVTEGPCREAGIRAFCRQRLAFYKVPRLIETYPALPRSAVGKVLKSELGGVEFYLDGIRGAETARIVAQFPAASPARRRVLLSSLVRRQAAAVLGQTVEMVPSDVGFTELGMDSFGSIELRARLEYLFGVELAETFTFDHPTVDAVAENMLEMVAVERT